MLRLIVNSQTAWANRIIVDGDINDDILRLIDDKFYEEGIEALNVPYIKGKDRNDDEDFFMVPINGGQYWIPSLIRIEEVSQ